MTDALIFDFDGVIADSEKLANQVLADMVSELGRETSLQQSYALFMGKRFQDVLASIEQLIGRDLPSDFPGAFQARTLEAFRAQLVPVRGVEDFLAANRNRPKAIASSSSPDRLALCLDVLGFKGHFPNHVYSASMVERGKPHPDIFLLAARELGVDPDAATVIEDSPSGVQAGVAAGMRVIGLTAASHIQPGHQERLLAAGAHHVADSYSGLAELL